MNIFVCSKCGHVSFDSAPDNCPVCYAPKDKFSQNDNLFKESEEKSPEGAVKHVPKLKVVTECGLFPEQECKLVSARIGETSHPMEEKHYIQFVDFYRDYKFIKRAMMTPALFAGAAAHLKDTSGKITVVEKCNLHGWWMSEISL